MPGDSGITAFINSLRAITLSESDEDLGRHREAILTGFAEHAQMAESMLRSSLVMRLSSQGGEEVQLAMSSRWSKIRVNQVVIPGFKLPAAVSVEFFFIQEHTDHDDPTEEVYDVLSRYIRESNYDLFIAQLVVNSQVGRFNRKVEESE